MEAEQRLGSLDHELVEASEDTAATHTLICDETHACELVVEFQTSAAGGPFYFSAPLAFAAAATNPDAVSGLTASPGNGHERAPSREVVR